MPLVRIPGTSKTIFVPAHSGDINVNLERFPDLGSSLKNEDVLVVGDWEDYSGSGTKGPTEVMYQGVVNTITDLTALSEGADDFKRTSRGARSSTHRQRPKIVNIEVK